MRTGMMLLASVTGLVVASNAGTSATLSEYFTTMTPKVIDRDYAPRFISTIPFSADLNGDGKEDLIVLGADYPQNGATSYAPQPGRVFLGDGNGNFSAAPATQFPVDTLRTVHPRKVLFSDFNLDGQLDMFIASHGWDASPFPGEQNRLYLSQPNGGWRDETEQLPQLSGFSHTAASGDLSGRGLMDVIVGNGYAGQNHILSYALLNNGSGQFTMTRQPIPVAAQQTLDLESGHQFNGATLTDLDGDGLPELIITGNNVSSFDKLTHSTILWNRSGVFNDASKTELPTSSLPFATHIDLDAQAIDANGDGLPDLVIVGTQGQPFYDGWFVQLLLNRGDHTFVDATESNLGADDRFGGVSGVATRTSWPIWVKVLDYNGDGFPDFAVEYSYFLQQSQPLIFLNDGTGHFTTLKVGDFVTAGNEWMLGSAHLVPTRNGYSFITLQLYPGSGGLLLTGLLANKPYRVHSVSTGTPSQTLKRRLKLLRQ